MCSERVRCRTLKSGSVLSNDLPTTSRDFKQELPTCKIHRPVDIYSGKYERREEREIFCEEINVANEEKKLPKLYEH